MKKFALALLLGLVAGVTQAELMLYWTVETGVYAEATYATLYAKTKTSTTGFEALDSIVIGSAVDTKIDGYDSSSLYMLKLFNLNGEAIAQSDNPASFSSILTSGHTWYTDTLGMKADEAMVLNRGMTFQSVPEPTSGLLMLLGLAGLALKRKRV